MKNAQGTDLLRSQIRYATIVSLVFSILIFIGTILLFPDELEWNSYPVFLIGTFLGAIVVLRKPLNPLSLNPRPHTIFDKLSHDEISTLIEKHWELIPRSAIWSAAIVYPLLMFIYNLIKGSVYTSPSFSFTSLLGGFATSVTFCGCISFIIMYRNWK
jgi:hypothetical protein